MSGLPIRDAAHRETLALVLRDGRSVTSGCCALRSQSRSASCSWPCGNRGRTRRGVRIAATLRRRSTCDLAWAGHAAAGREARGHRHRRRCRAPPRRGCVARRAPGARRRARRGRTMSHAARGAALFDARRRLRRRRCRRAGSQRVVPGRARPGVDRNPYGQLLLSSSRCSRDAGPRHRQPRLPRSATLTRANRRSTILRRNALSRSSSGSASWIVGRLGVTRRRAYSTVMAVRAHASSGAHGAIAMASACVWRAPR